MKKIFVSTHSSKIDGPVDYLSYYLIRKGYEVSYISNPLDNYEDRTTVIKKGNQVIKEVPRKNIGILNLFYDFYLSLRFLLKSEIDVFIGANNFDTAVGIVAKKLLGKKIERVVYFASDFSEKRFGNRFLDWIYYQVEKYVLENSDLVVSNTNRAQEKRLELGLKKEKSLVIPNGVHLDNEFFKEKDIDKGSFIYVGNVTKEHGLFDLLNVIHPLIKKFVLIGSGDDWDRVVGFCNDKDFEFESYFKKDHDFTINYLQNFNGIGLAPYNLESKWTYYCSPLKVSEYISCGIPVLMSDVPEIADLVKKEDYGITYNKLDFEDIKKKLDDFDTKDYYKRAETFYSEFRHEVLYGRLGL